MIFILKIIAAIIFVASGGVYFTKWGEKHPRLRVVIGGVGIVSFAYLGMSIWETVNPRQAPNLPQQTSTSSNDKISMAQGDRIVAQAEEHLRNGNWVKAKTLLNKALHVYSLLDLADPRIKDRLAGIHVGLSGSMENKNTGTCEHLSKARQLYADVPNRNALAQTEFMLRATGCRY